jgi:hypothetical protein
MKKYMKLCFGLLALASSILWVRADGPFPTPYSYQSYPTYQTNPSARMTDAQKRDIQAAFAWVDYAFNKNHTVCRDRNECLSLDLESLRRYIEMYKNNPSAPYLREVYNIILNDSLKQKFVSEWIIFQNLSPTRQSEYVNGLRVTPIRPQYITRSDGLTMPAYFNIDDVLTDLLESIDHYHKNCDHYVNCLRGDLQIVNSQYKRLATGDPARITLTNLYRNINYTSSKGRFDTNLYLKLYNPLSPSWSDMNAKYKARKLTEPGYQRWKEIEKVSRPRSWKTPRFSNSYPPNQYSRAPSSSMYTPAGIPAESYSPNAQGNWSRPQNNNQRSSDFLSKVIDLARTNKDLIKSWH